MSMILTQKTDRLLRSNYSPGRTGDQKPGFSTKIFASNFLSGFKNPVCLFGCISPKLEIKGLKSLLQTG